MLKREEICPVETTARIVGYWITTLLVVAELGVGGISDLFRTDQVRGVVEQLGYPTYLLIIMGAWKVAGLFFSMKKCPNQAGP